MTCPLEAARPSADDEGIVAAYIDLNKPRLPVLKERAWSEFLEGDRRVVSRYLRGFEIIAAELLRLRSAQSAMQAALEQAARAGATDG